MGRPPADPGREDTRLRLLRAATAAFAREGYARATLADVARVAGISRPSLLYHFASKDALYDAVVSGVFSDLAAVLGAEMAREAAWEARVEGLVVAFTRFLHGHGDHARLVVRELLDASDGRGAALARERVAPLLDGVVAFVRAGPVPAAVDVRAALLQVVSDALLAAAVGPLRAELWGPADPEAVAATTWALARRTLSLPTRPPEAP